MYWGKEEKLKENERDTERYKRKEMIDQDKEKQKGRRDYKDISCLSGW